MIIPKCCGKTMDISIETNKFMEVHCSNCGDTVFVKKGEAEKPQMLDD